MRSAGGVDGRAGPGGSSAEPRRRACVRRARGHGPRGRRAREGRHLDVHPRARRGLARGRVPGPALRQGIHHPLPGVAHPAQGRRLPRERRGVRRAFPRVASTSASPSTASGCWSARRSSCCCSPSAPTGTRVSRCRTDRVRTSSRCWWCSSATRSPSPTSARRKGRATRRTCSRSFFFILTLNLLGLVPWASTATGNLGVTAVAGALHLHPHPVRQHPRGGTRRLPQASDRRVPVVDCWP